MIYPEKKYVKLYVLIFNILKHAAMQFIDISAKSKIWYLGSVDEMD